MAKYGIDVDMELGMLRRNCWYSVVKINGRIYINGRLSTWWRRLYWWLTLTYYLVVGREHW